MATGNVDTSQIILNEEGTYQAKQQLYGLKVQLNDYAGAQAFLNAFPTTTQDEQWFKSVQEINLARLQNPVNFTLSAVQDSLLQVVALSQSPERGYARSLLSFLKGQLFERDIELPDAFQNPGAPQFIKSPVANHVVAQPNPTTNLVQVAIQEFEEEAVDIILFDFGGKPVRQFSFSGGNRFSLPLEDLPSGIYFLQAANSTRIIGRTKLVVSQ
ncbi:MAG: T9SS type A sorting domain-containing protein [Saprospiraceae bacterium]|nr:MAG: T9SS type A sorting domain-containing protein [Saprospiraceae bacterium]